MDSAQRDFPFINLLLSFSHRPLRKLQASAKWVSNQAANTMSKTYLINYLDFTSLPAQKQGKNLENLRAYICRNCINNKHLQKKNFLQKNPPGLACVSVGLTTKPKS